VRFVLWEMTDYPRKVKATDLETEV
jgi:hypothetical protein